MREALTNRRLWTSGETIIPLKIPLSDLGVIGLYATHNAWPLGSVVGIALQFFDTDDSEWKTLVGFTALGSATVDRKGNPVTEHGAVTRKRHPVTNQTLPYFQSWSRSRAHVPACIGSDFIKAAGNKSVRACGSAKSGQSPDADLKRCDSH